LLFNSALCVRPPWQVPPLLQVVTIHQDRKRARARQGGREQKNRVTRLRPYHGAINKAHATTNQEQASNRATGKKNPSGVLRGKNPEAHSWREQKAGAGAATVASSFEAELSAPCICMGATLTVSRCFPGSTAKTASFVKHQL
jgi:hypothetical protein